MEVDVGDVLPLLSVAGIVTLARLMLPRGLLASRLTSAAARGTLGSPLWRSIPRATIDALVDVVLVAIALVHLGVFAVLFASIFGTMP